MTLPNRQTRYIVVLFHRGISVSQHLVQTYSSRFARAREKVKKKTKKEKKKKGSEDAKDSTMVR